MEPMNSADHLVEIFKYFGPAVHSQLLIVNRRMNRIITRPTWEYRSLLSIGQYPQLADQPSFPLLQSVCSNRREMLKVLDLSKPIAISGQEMFELIRLLDELEHLNIRGIPLSNDALKYIGRNLHALRFIGFCLQVSNDYDGLDDFLSFCTKLKVLKIYDGELRNWSDQIAHLPKSLKCVDIRPAIRSKKFLELLAALKIKLEYLVINDRDLNMNLFVKVDFTELKYLGLPMVVGYEKCLWFLKHDMKALRGLEMSFYEMGPEDFEKLFAGLLRNFQQLRHIGLSQVSLESEQSLLRLVNFRQLCSLRLHLSRTSTPQVSNSLFRDISPRLQFFSTNKPLPIKLISNALVANKKLSTIVCRRERQPGIGLEHVVTALSQGEGLRAAGQDSVVHFKLDVQDTRSFPVQSVVKFYSAEDQIDWKKRSAPICFQESAIRLLAF